MSARGFYRSQNGHTVPIIPPQDVEAGKTSAYFNMALAEHVSILLSIGAITGGPGGAVTVLAATSEAGANPTAIPFTVYKCETGSGDVLGPAVQCTAAGFVPANTADIFYVIEIDAAIAFDPLFAAPPGLDLNFHYLALAIAAGATHIWVAADALLTGLKFAGDQNQTALV